MQNVPLTTILSTNTHHVGGHYPSKVITRRLAFTQASHSQFPENTIKVIKITLAL